MNWNCLVIQGGMSCVIELGPNLAGLLALLIVAATVLLGLRVWNTGDENE